MVGKKVTVRTPSYAYDANKNEVVSWTSVEVDDVLIAPKSTADANGEDRTHGTRATVVFGFPKGFSASLRGCKVVCPAPFSGTWDIVGDPVPNIAENCPTRWWYTAEGVRADG